MLNQLKDSKIWAAMEREGLEIILLDPQNRIARIGGDMAKQLDASVEACLGQSIHHFFPQESFGRGESEQIHPGPWREIKLRSGSRCGAGFLAARVPLRWEGKLLGLVLLLEPKPQKTRGVNFWAGRQVELVGAGERFAKILVSAHCVAQTDSTVLLRGESGTGKDLIATYIHSIGARRNKPFLSINCTAIPASLLESELFGYVGGAFTGAEKGGKCGLLEAADQGTVVFEEVTEMALFMQVKILRFLQEGTIRRLGDIAEKKLNVRVIASTHRDIEKMVGRGEFREDLYYRLNVFPIFIPPLRERKEDIPLLANYCIAKLNSLLHTRVTSIGEKALSKLEQYSWPGNIRELECILERAMIIAKGSEIQEEDLLFDAPISSGNAKYRQLYLQEGYSLKQIMAAAEEDLLRRALGEHRSVRRTARALGLSHTALLNKMKKLGITPEECRQGRAFPPSLPPECRK